MGKASSSETEFVGSVVAKEESWCVNKPSVLPSRGVKLRVYQRASVVLCVQVSK